MNGKRQGLVELSSEAHFIAGNVNPAAKPPKVVQESVHSVTKRRNYTAEIAC